MALSRASAGCLGRGQSWQYGLLFITEGGVQGGGQHRQLSFPPKDGFAVANFPKINLLGVRQGAIVDEKNKA